MMPNQPTAASPATLARCHAERPKRRVADRDRYVAKITWHNYG